MAAVSTYSNGREYNSPRTQERETNHWDFNPSINQEVAGLPIWQIELRTLTHFADGFLTTVLSE